MHWQSLISFACLSFLLHRWLTSARLQKDTRTDLYDQCAIARLVNRISGWSEESVRVRVANGVNYSGPQGRRDVKLVSSMLDEVNPLYADRIRGNI